MADSAWKSSTKCRSSPPPIRTMRPTWQRSGTSWGICCRRTGYQSVHQSRKLLALPWKFSIPGVVAVAGHRVGDDRLQIGILPHELGNVAARQAEQVVQHEHLAVAAGAGADADGGNRQLGSQLDGNRRRNALQHDGESP